MDDVTAIGVTVGALVTVATQTIGALVAAYLERQRELQRWRLDRITRLEDRRDAASAELTAEQGALERARIESGPGPVGSGSAASAMLKALSTEGALQRHAEGALERRIEDLEARVRRYDAELAALLQHVTP